jgi:hypothetical protein
MEEIIMSKKKQYKKPTIKSEKLNTYGAVCNGTTAGGRKATSGPPNPCRSNRLNS